MAKKKAHTETKPQLTVKREGGRIWSHLRKKWLEETPEERVRQSYLCVLVNEYGFELAQMAEEKDVTGRGAGNARADFVIWRTEDDQAKGRNPLIVVECKSDNVTITSKDYGQGDNYARLTGAKFLITHNSRETKYWRVIHERMPKTLEEVENVPDASATDKQIEALLARLKVFREDEFADLLHQCHNVIRNRDHLDPAAAFDEIAKVLFIKTWVERELRKKRRRKNIFSVSFLEEQIGDDPIGSLFSETKKSYRVDRIFESGESVRLKPATAKEIVRRLERYNLSETSEDIKGIAFERFLGRTFRGEIGQFFTPRTIVEFMIRFLDPQEGETICDPASGSGGFLIRFFEIVREKILMDVDREYQSFKAAVDKKRISKKEKAERLRAEFDRLQKTIGASVSGSRIWSLANKCIFGTDANGRMARTSKMNMIMHGDGHGGVHHHNGFINVNGIFEGRFDIVLTNPPFGASVEPTDVVTPGEVEVSDEDFEEYRKRFGKPYEEAQARAKASSGLPIAQQFTLGVDKKQRAKKVKTEILFLERCLELLEPGGRMGIVLPEGVVNNPTAAHVRAYCEERAFVRAVVSLPPNTFKSSKADVKASLLFVQRFTVEQEDLRETLRQEAMERAHEAVQAKHRVRRAELVGDVEAAENARERKRAERLLRAFEEDMDAEAEEITADAVRSEFDYKVFMYDARNVGITPTGEADDNELYPNERMPNGLERTCLEEYRAFLASPDSRLPGE